LTIGRTGLQPIFDFIDETGDDPFFVWYAPFLPHWPHDPPARLLEKYVSAERPIELSRYYAMCEWFDETVGELLAHLGDEGHRGDTLVALVADNGWIQRTPETEVPPGWELAFAPRSKQSPYDGGTRTPIILRWPGVIEPGRYETPVSSIDLAPTILAAAGRDPAPGMPGVNLLDVIRGVAPRREAIFGEGFAHDITDIDDPRKSLLYRWCIEGRLKLIVTDEGQVGRYQVVHPQTHRSAELYDLEADPFETRDLGEAHPEIVARLSSRLAGWWTVGSQPGGGEPLRVPPGTSGFLTSDPDM
jgi:arylsulfatase A-like enzyme